MATGWIRRTPPTRKAPRGRWRACYRTPIGDTRSRAFDRKEDASRWLSKQATTIAEGGYIDPRAGRTRFAAFWEQFLQSSPHLRPTTRDGYERLGRLYLLPTSVPGA